MFRAVLTAAFFIPSAGLAAGGGDAPKPSQTTQTCTGGKVWDKKSKACIEVKSDLLEDDALYEAVREFAYMGQIDHAQAALREMSDQTEGRVLTYWGYTTRKSGDMAAGMAFYRQAIAKNPANILARSYMGQALVEQGDLTSARAELAAIRAHGGKGSWAETSLKDAIITGQTSNY